MVESASSAINDRIVNERDRIKAVLAAKIADLPAAFNQAAQMVKQGFKHITATNAFKEWKNDLFTRIVGQGDE
jgi:hypothetical protein